MGDLLKVKSEQKKLPNDEAVADKIKPLESKLAELKKGDIGPIVSQRACSMKPKRR